MITAEEIANYDDYLIVSKKGISRLIKETCRDANGQNLTDEIVKEILDKAKATKET